MKNRYVSHEAMEVKDRYVSHEALNVTGLANLAREEAIEEFREVARKISSSNPDASAAIDAAADRIEKRENSKTVPVAPNRLVDIFFREGVLKEINDKVLHPKGLRMVVVTRNGEYWAARLEEDPLRQPLVPDKRLRSYLENFSENDV